MSSNILESVSDIAQAGDIFGAIAGKIGALVRPGDPPLGIAGYLFNIVEDEKVTLTSDITDFVLEDKTLAQDHATLKPEEVTVNGLVAELHGTPSKEMEFIEPYIRALDPVAGYIPQLATNARRYYNEAQRIQGVMDKVSERTKSLFDLFKARSGSGPKVLTYYPSEAGPNLYDPFKTANKAWDWGARQREAYEFFRYLWSTKILVTVETPWGIYENMAVKSMTVQQDSKSRSSSSFQMTFKQIRIVGDPGKASKKTTGRTAENASVSNVGPIPGTTVNRDAVNWGITKQPHPESPLY